MERIHEITRRVSEIRAFTDESYLKTTHFTVFLLFGCSDAIKEVLQRRAREIIVDKKAIAFLPADNAEDITAEVRSAVDDVSRSGVDLQNLNELHFCPLIISDMAEPGRFASVVDSLEAYRESNDLNTVWKPFIILDTEHPATETWLSVLAGKTKALTGRLCRSCVMTRRNEDNFAVDDERLLDTALFVALLHANINTREGIGRRISYSSDYPDELFYTAQSVFISNPIIMRTLRCMHMLLEAVEEDGNPEREPDLSFARELLEPLYEKLPREGNQISFAPLYGVMPDPDGNSHEFLFRLRDFSRKHYLSQFEVNKEELFARFRSCYLRAFIESGKTVEFLQSIVGNNAEIERLSRTTTAFQMSALPELTRKSGLSQENAAVYADIEHRLRTKLNGLGTELLREFFNSEDFISLPGLYNEARKLVRDICSELAGEADRRGRYGAEIYLELSGDPDEKLVKEASKELKSQSFFSQYFAAITLAVGKGSRGGVDEALTQMLDGLFNSVRGLAGGSGAREYMELLSRTCQDPNGTPAKRCVAAVGTQLKFPVRFYNDGRKKCTFVWGSQDNSFFSAWERQQTIVDTENEFLPINSKERFVLLTVSPAFTRGDIRGISGAPPAPEKEV